MTLTKADCRQRRPLSGMQGDSTAFSLYISVGFALSSWEMIENSLATVFDTLLPSEKRIALSLYHLSTSSADRAYVLSGLVDIVERTGEHPSLKALRSILELAKELRSRRNEIAHGVVLGSDKYGFYLCPSLVNMKQFPKGRASYQYRSEDVVHYAFCFVELDKMIADDMAGLCDDFGAPNKLQPLINHQEIHNLRETILLMARAAQKPARQM